jgi:hypothetical protein
MVYMAANNSLSGAAGIDLDEMRRVGSSDAVKLLAFVKQRGTGAAQYLQVGRDGQDEVVEDVGRLDSGNPQTVVDFVRWGVQTAPADRYALVLWNHGGGWTPDDLEELYSAVRADTGVTRGEVNFLNKGRVGRAVFSTTIQKILALPTAQDRAICNDDTSGHSLDTIEVANILTAATRETGRPLDLFGMDACLMSTLEVAYELRDLTQVVVGSEELEPAAGWAYDTLLTELASNPEMDGRRLGKAVVRTYIDSYGGAQGQGAVTQCAVQTSGIGAFTDALASFTRAVVPSLPDKWPQVQRAQALATKFMFDLADLKSFCQQLAGMAVGDDIRQGCQGILDALQPGTYVLAEGHDGASVADCGGVSLYLPSPMAEISRYYGDLQFAEALEWDDFLRSYQKAMRGP